MVRPIALVFQEFAETTATTPTPDLNCLITGPAYQILDYPEDSDDISVADYGDLEADNPYTPPAASSPEIVLAAPPGITAGAWVDPASITVIFDEARVEMASGSDGATTTDSNAFTSAGATFETDGVAAGDILIVDNPAGPATPNLVLTVSSVDSETQLSVTTNFTATVAGTLNWRVERELSDQTIDSSYIDTPTFRASNEVTILGGVDLAVDGTNRTVTYAKVYVAYRAFRTDLQVLDSVSTTNEIETKIGKIEARNPLAVAVSVAKQNAGNSPIQFYGVESDDATGYSKMREEVSSDSSVYAVVPLTLSLSILNSYKQENETLADPNEALDNGVPQKFRVVIGSSELPEESELTVETNTGTTEQVTGAVPPGNKTITIASLTAQTDNLQPGDQLIVTASENVSSLDGTYSIAHINSETEIETDEAFPTLVASAEGANYRVYRPSTNTDVVPLVDNRAQLTIEDVNYISRVAGVTPGARTIAKVEDASTPDGIHSVVEVAGTSTVINGNFASGNITAQDIVDALTDGSGVTTSFAGSVNLVAETSTPATAQTAAVAAALSTGTAGTDDVSSVAVLDEAYLRLFDSTATFITDGVIAGDIIEVPDNPNGIYGTTFKQFTVGTVISEQRLEIDNIESGSYVNNTSTEENELPHEDNRLGTGTDVTQGTIRYRVVRELTKDQQVTSLISEAQSLNSRRAILVWPDLCDVTDLLDGSVARQSDGTKGDADSQPGYYLAAAVGGMTAGLPSHQGFSRLGISGIDRIYNSNTYFTERQLSTLSDGGWYVFSQATTSSLPYSIHQLTTDPSTLESGEYSVVKNFDFVSLFYLDVLEPFLGVWNVNNDTLGFVRQALNTATSSLKLRRVAKIGAPLNDAVISSVEVSDASADRIEATIEVDLPRPLNVIGLHLVA